MGWEKRKRGGRYYVQKERVGNTVTSRYLGCSDHAAGIADLEEILRNGRTRIGEEEKQKRRRLDAISAGFAEYFETVEAILREALTAAGYHQHHRGVWRKQRNGKEPTD